MTGADPRLVALGEAAFNTARLPASAVPCDLSTDLRSPEGSVVKDTDQSELESAIGEVFGIDGRGCIITARGRVAEAAVAAALVRPGGLVLANEVYVTGAWSIVREGGRVRGIGGAATYRSGRGLIEGLDLDAFAAAIAEADVSCLWLTSPRVLLGPRGGSAVEREALVQIVRLRDRLAPSLPLVIDATKIGEWAVRSSVEKNKTAEGELRTLAGLADMLLLSARKDAGGVPRGLLVVPDPARRRQLRRRAARVLDRGSRVDERCFGALACGLRGMTGAAAGRWEKLDAVARDLLKKGAPIVGWGGGALFINAALTLPRVPQRANPAQTLLGLLYLRAGIRGLGTPLGTPGPSLVRLSLRDLGSWLGRHLERILSDLAGWTSGLIADGAPSPGPYLEGMMPVDRGPWQRLACDLHAPVTEGPAVLGMGAERGLADRVRACLGLAGLQVQPLRAPRERLAELWRRQSRASACVHGSPELAAAAKRWPCPDLGSCGDLWLGRIDELSALLDSRRRDDLVVVELRDARGRSWRQAWQEASVHPRAAEVDLWIVPVGTLTAGAGALLVLTGSDLAAALASSTLFAVGSPGVGGLDGDELAAMEAGLCGFSGPDEPSATS